MARNRENRVEKYLGKRIKEIGGLSLKWTCPGNAGVPDRICFLPGGRLLLVEVKTVDGKLSRVQESMHGKLGSLGYPVCTVYGKKDVDNLIAFETAGLEELLGELRAQA